MTGTLSSVSATNIVPFTIWFALLSVGTFAPFAGDDVPLVPPLLGEVMFVPPEELPGTPEPLFPGVLEEEPEAENSEVAKTVAFGWSVIAVRAVMLMSISGV